MDEVIKYLLDQNFKSVQDNFSPDFMTVENTTGAKRISIIINDKSKHCNVILHSLPKGGTPKQLMKQYLKFDEILNGDLDKIIMEYLL